MIVGRRVALALVSVQLALACSPGARGGPRVGSESHFLVRCEADDPCGSLECIAGFCTKPCSSEGDCQALSPSATCRAASTLDADGTSSDGRDACDVMCNSDNDCDAVGAGFACEDEGCRREEASIDATAGSVTDDGTASSCAGFSMSARGWLLLMSSGASRECDVAPDCEAVELTSTCHASCLSQAFSIEGAMDVRAIQADIEAGTCQSFRDADCVQPAPMCPAPDFEVVTQCVGGRCEQTTPDAPTCEVLAGAGECSVVGAACSQHALAQPAGFAAVDCGTDMENGLMSEDAARCAVASAEWLQGFLLAWVEEREDATSERLLVGVSDGSWGFVVYEYRVDLSPPDTAASMGSAILTRRQCERLTRTDEGDILCETNAEIEERCNCPRLHWLTYPPDSPCAP